MLTRAQKQRKDSTTTPTLLTDQADSSSAGTTISILKRSSSSSSLVAPNKPSKSVIVDSTPSIREIPLTPNNPCRKDYRKLRILATPPPQKYLSDSAATNNPLSTCPCGFPCSPKLKATIQDWIFCDLCQQWFHRECLNITKKVFDVEIEPNPFSCLTCSFQTKVNSLDSALYSHFASKSTAADTSTKVGHVVSCDKSEFSDQVAAAEDTQVHANTLSPSPDPVTAPSSPTVPQLHQSQSTLTLTHPSLTYLSLYPLRLPH